MRLTYNFTIKKSKYKQLMELCKISNNLYNQANYIIKRELKNNNNYLNYYTIEKLMKNQPEGFNNYKKLKAQCSQQTLKLLDNNWKSYFKSVKAWKVDSKKYKGIPKAPNYKTKGSEFLLVYSNQSSQIKDNYLILAKDIRIKIPQEIDLSNFKQVRVLPRGNRYKIEIIYEVETENKELDYTKYAGIDLGLNNILTLASEDGCLIFDGKYLKSINQHYNKYVSQLKSIRDKQESKTINNRKIKEKCYVRDNKINDAMHKISRMVINFCIKNKIGNICIGENKNWKDSISIGKKNNQNFVNIPFSKLINFIKYKAELVGIKVICIEESYTSKCDALALEEIGKQDTYLGKRVERGLFQSSTKKLIKADINGAINIIRKVIGNLYDNIIVNSRVWFNPIKIRIRDYQTFNDKFIKEFSCN